MIFTITITTITTITTSRSTTAEPDGKETSSREASVERIEKSPSRVFALVPEAED